MSTPLVEFQSVAKDYPLGLIGRRKLRALDSVSFAIGPGEVFGLVGPNRAGKTTLVKLLLSLCRPTSGAVFRFGAPAAQRHTLRRVGYVHENQAFPRYLSARQLLEYYGALTFLAQPRVKDLVPALLERVGLADRADEPISRFSKGMVQRLGVAQALLNDPDLLVLDEPSEGLDLSGRQLVRDIIGEQKAKGKTVLFVSHLIPEIERLCDRIAVVRTGRLIYHGPVVDLKRAVDGSERPLEDVLGELYFAKAG
ncbi:MAG: ABC transporter ATP-binding protein [Gemmataceae bacterium]